MHGASRAPLWHDVLKEASLEQQYHLGVLGRNFRLVKNVIAQNDDVFFLWALGSDIRYTQRSRRLGRNVNNQG